MKLGIMQPYFFPYVGYFQCISAVDKYILYDALAYIKSGWINRNRYLVVHHQPRSFHPHLSILDVLMNCGKQGAQHLLREYDLI